MKLHGPAQARASRGVPRLRRHRGRGQTLVEFALVFPVFIILLAGIVDFGFGFYSYMTVLNGARVGTRVAVLNPTDPNSAIEGAVNSEAVALTGAVAMATQCEASGTTTWKSCTTSGYTPTTGDLVKVTVSYTYNMIWPLPFASTLPMTATVEMMIE